MYPKSFVICDVEQEYARNLMQAFKEHRELGFQIHLFQRMEDAQEFSREKQVHILLAGEDYETSQRQLVRAREKYVLVKGGSAELLDDEKAVYKYQASDKILSAILREAQEGEGLGAGSGAHGGKLIGIYSPIRRIGKTKFALDLGKETAKKEPVLYLNLEEYSGGCHYFPGQQGDNLGDLIYFIRQEKGNLGLRISAMAGQIKGLDYIAPIPVMQDLWSVEETQWLGLFEEIFANCLYRTIILDLGDSIRGLYRILRECQTVYTLYMDDPLSMAKLAQYTENLRQTGYEDVLEHTVQKKIQLEAGGCP